MTLMTVMVRVVVASVVVAVEEVPWGWVSSDHAGASAEQEGFQSRLVHLGVLQGPFGVLGNE